MLRVEQITDFEQLRPEWLELFARCPNATPFQHPAWLIAWWRVFHPGKLAALALRSDGRLVAVAPMYIADGTLRLIGAGITDYLDVLSDPAIDDCGVTPLLCGALDFPWDCCFFDDLPPWSLLLRGHSADESSVCPVATLPVTISSKLRTNLRQAGLKLRQLGELRFETETGANHADQIDALFRLHRARWETRGESGVLATSEVRAFHRCVAEAFSSAGMLRFHALRFKGEISAIWYWFAWAGRAYCYLSGFDPRLARFSPGSLLTEYAINDAIRRGDRECDFLRGSEQYKYVWGALDRSNYRLSARRNALLGLRMRA